MQKRLFDLGFSALGLLVLSPLFLILAVLVKRSDRGPVFFRQQRIGRGGKPFTLLKFRSMVINAEQLGASVTMEGDPRITPIGRFLRQTKLDELPQLWNVFVGDMTFVGPRPEVPEYVAQYTPEQRQVLNLKPGITDLATLEFREEEELLRSAADMESFYMGYCVPRKIALNMGYAQRANLWQDTVVILRTLFPGIVPNRNNGRLSVASAAREKRVAGRWFPRLLEAFGLGHSRNHKGSQRTNADVGSSGNGSNGSDDWEGGPHWSLGWLGVLTPRRLLVVGVAAGLLLACRWLAYQLRFDFDVPEPLQVQLERHWFWVIALQLVCLYIGGQFSGIYRYFSLSDLQRLAAAMALSGALLYGVRFLHVGYSPPLGVILPQTVFGFLTLAALRTTWRMVHERFLRGPDRAIRKCRVGIIGAGDVASSLISDLAAHPNLGLVPVAVFDDDPAKWRARLHGIRIVGPVESIGRQSKRLKLEKMIIAMPSAPAKRLGEVVSLLRTAKLPHVTVPGIDQLTNGEVRVSQLRPVRIEDLLGRDPIDLRMGEISGVLKGKVVMVTGAGGSIGSELCRQVAAFHPARLLLLDQSEVQLFQIEQELIERGYRDIIQPLIADILDQARMGAVFRWHHPSVIFHAAAHKHVGMMENQPSEAIKNNAIGTAILAELALEFEVERFVMISTDKAVNPTSVMGASKRLAEMFAQALAHENPGRTRIAAVRFGNVLGSSGSVVPIFERQIAQGGPVTVTHPDVVRYFMTIPEAVGLVLQSCALGKGGEIFVLDMGKPVRIADLARQMIRLSGLEPDEDIQIEYIGLKPGEKLYEELHHLQANCIGTTHPRIKCLTSQPEPLEVVRGYINRLDGLLHKGTANELKRILKSILPEYRPYLEGDGTGGKGRGAGVSSGIGDQKSEVSPRPLSQPLSNRELDFRKHEPAQARSFSNRRQRRTRT